MSDSYDCCAHVWYVREKVDEATGFIRRILRCADCGLSNENCEARAEVDRRTVPAAAPVKGG